MQKKETSTRSFGNSMKKFFLQSWSSSVVAIVLLVVIFAITTSAFLTQYNLFNLSRTAAVYAFIAGAQLMVAVIGGMNLAVGAVGALSSVILGLTIQDLGLSTPVAILVTLLVGAACGFINGFLVVKLKLSGFIITLAMSFIYEGIAVGVSHGYAYKLTQGFTALGRSKVGPTSGLFVIMIIFILLLAVFFRNARFGRDILATGGNEAAAALSGIRTDRIKIASDRLFPARLRLFLSLSWNSKEKEFFLCWLWQP